GAVDAAGAPPGGVGGAGGGHRLVGQLGGGTGKHAHHLVEVGWIVAFEALLQRIEPAIGDAVLAGHGWRGGGSGDGVLPEDGRDHGLAIPRVGSDSRMCVAASTQIIELTACFHNPKAAVRSSAFRRCDLSSNYNKIVRTDAAPDNGGISLGERGPSVPR